jgi:hypothetical protein
MESPLLQSNIRFGDICETLGISKAAADILDDMRFLTSCIIALSTIVESAATFLPPVTSVLRTLVKAS